MQVPGFADEKNPSGFIEEHSTERTMITILPIPPFVYGVFLLYCVSLPIT
jgi:hypothetical protein